MEFLYWFRFLLAIASGAYILKHYWTSLLRLAAYLALQLVFISLLIYFGLTPKPLLAATLISPELSIKPELVHARIHAVLTPA